jgi:hypothetical protein
VLDIATVAIPYSPPKAQPSKGAATARVHSTGTVPDEPAPVTLFGSVVAFFRSEREGGSPTKSLTPRIDSKAIATATPAPKTAAAGTGPRGSSIKSAASVASQPVVPSATITSAARRKGANAVGQKSDARQHGPTTSSSNENHAKKAGAVGSTASAGGANNPAMAAAAANRRSKRTLLQRLGHHVTLWWEARRQRLDIGGYFQPRPLIIALLYSVLMILALNLVLKSDHVASFEYMRRLASAQNFKQLLTPDLWASVLTGGGSALSQFGHSNAPQPSLEVDDAPKSAFDFSAARFSLFAASDGDTEPSAPFLASPAGAFGRAFSSAAGPVPALLPPTHWVKEGDSITFGDYGSYGASEPKSAPGQNAAPTAARSASTATGAGASQPSRTTASTASAVPKTRTAPSENVQRTQYVPKSEYVLSANAALKSPYTYQWTKDGVNITNGFYVNQPYFSIKRTRREDAGLYRCYRCEVAVAKAPAVLVLETALQISSKLSTSPCHFTVLFCIRTMRRGYSCTTVCAFARVTWPLLHYIRFLPRVFRHSCRAADGQLEAEPPRDQGRQHDGAQPGRRGHSPTDLPVVQKRLPRAGPHGAGPSNGPGERYALGDVQLRGAEHRGPADVAGGHDRRDGLKRNRSDVALPCGANFRCRATSSVVANGNVREGTHRRRSKGKERTNVSDDDRTNVGRDGATCSFPDCAKL